MKILNREFYPLKSGHTFAVLTLRGERGEEINIAKEGVSEEVIFFSEAPKTDNNCTYYPKENIIELGGIERESERTLFLIAGPNKV